VACGRRVADVDDPGGDGGLGHAALLVDGGLRGQSVAQRGARLVQARSHRTGGRAEAHGDDALRQIGQVEEDDGIALTGRQRRDRGRELGGALAGSMRSTGSSRRSAGRSGSEPSRVSRSGLAPRARNARSESMRPMPRQPRAETRRVLQPVQLQPAHEFGVLGDIRGGSGVVVHAYSPSGS